MQSGIILKTTGSHYKVKLSNGSIIDTSIRGKLRLKGIKTTNPVTVGDIVDVEIQNDGSGIIINIHPRKNYIIRKSSNLSREAHIIAANIDQTLLIVTVTQPLTQFAFIDRYLVTAEAYSIPAILIFNKTDLINNSLKPILDEYIHIYESIGYKCVQVSGINGLNINILKDLIKNKISLISGNSGVGKSTLINAVEPSLNLKVDEISKAHLLGKHTTTFSEMFELSFGGYIIDTPGIKGFGLIDIDKNELYHFFPEIFKFSKGCKFYNCTHIHEPECAVIDAVNRGEISASRYINYVNIYNDDNEKYR